MGKRRAAPQERAQWRGRPIEAWGKKEQVQFRQLCQQRLQEELDHLLVTQEETGEVLRTFLRMRVEHSSEDIAKK